MSSSLMLFRSSSKLYCCCWLLIILSLGQRRLVSAFSPRLPRTLSHQPVGRQWLQQTPPNFQRQSIVRSATAAPARKALVVYGPPDFDKNAKKSKRPFKLVIVESPSKCATISKILQQYVKDNGLGHDYVVTSCMGHVRNLSSKKTDKNQTIAGIDIEDRYKPTYVILAGKERLCADLQDLSGKAQQLVLATDDDREGEAMASHLLDLLNTEDGKTVDRQELPPLRVRFTEITPKAILESIQNPSTSLAHSLVQAQETRRILDRLAGYTVSPLLWKKIAPGLSAGRVQSVGMALIVQRERLRLLFRESEYWDVEAEWYASKQQFSGQLVARNGQAIVSGGGDFEPQQANTLTEASKHKLHLQQEETQELVHRLQTENWAWTVANVTSTQRKLNSPPPFITSTLQQEANKRLALSVSRVMQTAQQLYENGYISYMRTDSNHLSEDAQKAIRSEIVNDYGGPDFYQPRTNKPKKATKKKGGKDGKEEANKPEPQAAHEAIRPAIQPDGGFAKASELPIDGAAKELYELIYQRTVASHMPPQVSNQTSIRIIGEYEDESVLFRTSGSVIIFPGYTVVYPQKTEKDSPTLPPLKEGQSLDCNELVPLGHITQPPARYTEASFVQELEALGVGRPSTYAGVIQTLRDRAYVGSPIGSGDAAPRSRGSAKVVSGPAISAQRAAGGEEFTGAGNARGPLVPSLSAFVVTSLLENHCPTYVDPSFTAQMEERLDQIANSELGQDERVAYLDEFYAGDEGLAAIIKKIEFSVSADEARRANLPALAHIASPNGSAGDDQDVGLFIGPWGPYIQRVEANGAAEDLAEKKKPLTASLPSGMAADLSTITRDILNAILASKEENGTILGPHPEDGRNIRLKLGRFGAYLQWGEDGEEGTTTHSVPRSIGNMRNIDAAKAKEDGFSLNAMLGISLESAIQYVNLPRTVCTFNDLPIVAAIGPYGPYLKYNNTYMSLNKNDGDVIDIEAETAEALVTEGIINRKTKLARGVLAEIGEKDGGKVRVKDGRFGMYISWKKVNAKIPSQYMDNPSELPLDEAWTLIEEKAATMTGTTGKTKKGKSANGAASVDLPPAPKRPLSSYLHFCAEKRAQVAGTLKSLGEVSKELARLWAEISDKDRETYIDLAAGSKVEYEEKKTLWEKECNEILEKTGTKQTGKAKSSRTTSIKGSTGPSPKRPKSAYLYFCADKRPKVSEQFQRLGDISKEIARQWAEITAEERKEFDVMAAADKVRYEDEKIGASAGIASAKKGQAVGKTAKTATTKKRAPSAYMLFCAEHRESIVDEDGNKLPLGQTTKRLAQMWKECKVEYEEKKTLLENESNETLEKTGTKQTGKAKSSRTTSIKGSTGPSPKRPKSAYLYFCADKRPKVSEQFQRLGDISKEIARQWAEITAEERKEFDVMAAADKVRYEDEKIGASAGIASAKKGQAVGKTAKTATTKKRAPTAYMLFCAEHRESIVDEDGNKLPLGQTTKRLAQMWKECHDDARARLEAEAAKQKELLVV